MTKTTILAVCAAAGLWAGTEARAESHDMDHSGMEAAGVQPIEVGDLRIEGAFARATRPGQPVGGGYMTITNTGDAEDRLVSVSTVLAASGEIHEMAMEGDVMRMRALPDGLPIPAGETVTLEPGGYHLMFMQLDAPLVQGEIAPVILTFEEAGEIEVPLPIAASDADGMGHAQQ